MEMPLVSVDSEVYGSVRAELERERRTLVLIASENYVSRAVLEAQANVMTNKYAEGYPGARYYGGCEYVDRVERLAMERARKLFGCTYANVQPHSGSQANMAVYFAMLSPGDTVLGMDLAHGGHLTHGSSVSFSGAWFRALTYGVHPSTHRIDYDQVRDLAKRHRPRMIIAGASAYPRDIDFQLFAEIAREVGAQLLVDMAHIAGLVAAGVHPSPVGHADIITATTHKTLRGPRGGLLLAETEFGRALDRALFPGIQGGPLMHIVAAKAVAFGEALRPEFREYQRQVVRNAHCLAQELMANGFDLISGGTDNHLLLVNLSSTGITGAKAEEALGRVGLVVNKNAIPFDTLGPRVTSGIRLGTPALTTRGMREPEMAVIARLISDILRQPDSETAIRKVSGQVSELCEAFPLYRFLDS